MKNIALIVSKSFIGFICLVLFMSCTNAISTGDPKNCVSNNPPIKQAFPTIKTLKTSPDSDVTYNLTATCGAGTTIESCTFSYINITTPAVDQRLVIWLEIPLVIDTTTNSCECSGLFGQNSNTDPQQTLEIECLALCTL